jgi:hypothetical protein
VEFESIEPTDAVDEVRRGVLKLWADAFSISCPTQPAAAGRTSRFWTLSIVFSSVIGVCRRNRFRKFGLGVESTEVVAKFTGVVETALDTVSTDSAPLSINMYSSVISTGDLAWYGLLKQRSDISGRDKIGPGSSEMSLPSERYGSVLHTVCTVGNPCGLSAYDISCIRLLARSVQQNQPTGPLYRTFSKN